MTPEEKRARSLQAQKEYQARNPELVKQRKRKHYAANAERLREQRKAYCYANRKQEIASSRTASKRIREQRKAEGLCVHCAAPAVTGLTSCQNCRELLNARARATHPYRRYRYKALYGLTAERLALLLAAQENRCAICGEAFDFSKRRAFVIDHDHASGAVRGALCTLCNVGLGSFGDDEERMASAIRYLGSARAIQLEVAS